MSTPATRAASAPTRAATPLLCVVEEVADLWALDRSRLFPGRYHVLGGRLSALEGVRPEDLGIDSLVSRVAEGGIDEVVLAMNATLEGQTTAHYLAERLEKFPDPPDPARPRPAGRRRARLSRRRHARPGAAGAAAGLGLSRFRLALGPQAWSRCAARTFQLPPSRAQTVESAALKSIGLPFMRSNLVDHVSDHGRIRCRKHHVYTLEFKLIQRPLTVPGHFGIFGRVGAHCPHRAGNQALLGDQRLGRRRRPCPSWPARIGFPDR